MDPCFPVQQAFKIVRPVDAGFGDCVALLDPLDGHGFLVLGEELGGCGGVGKEEEYD